MDSGPSSLCVNENEEVLKIIKKHPYFKNPCKYPIRIISIMKYLKKKGFEVNKNDLDLKVDKMISDLPYVDKIDYGLYRVEK